MSDIYVKKTMPMLSMDSASGAVDINLINPALVPKPLAQEIDEFLSGYNQYMEGYNFPTSVAYWDGETYWLVSDRLVYEAAKKVGMPWMYMDCTRGSVEDAVHHIKAERILDKIEEGSV